MWQRVSATGRWGLVVAAAAFALAAFNIWWVLKYREGYPFNIDEAGYTAFGYVDYLGFKYEGVSGWWDAIQGQPTFAPLVPALTSFVLWIHASVLSGFVTLSVFVVVLALGAYAIGARLAGPKLGALAALVSTTLPGAIAFSREYVYALPVAALMTWAVFSILRSDGLRARRWAIACGAFCGLMLLTRTMAIAYIPGALAPGLLAMWLRAEDDLRQRLVNLGLLLVTMLAVAATWYANNIVSVWEYLTEYGYGEQAKNYGSQNSLISLGRFRSVGEKMVNEDIYLPLALLLLAGLVTLVVVGVKMLRPPETRRAVLRRLGSSETVGVALVVAIGYVALMSSQNGGNGFTIPLSVLVPPLAVVALRRFPVAAVPATALVALVAAFNILSLATVWEPASRGRYWSAPGFHGAFTITRGQPGTVAALRVQIPGTEYEFDPSESEWLAADMRMMERLGELYEADRPPPIVAFASRNRVFSSNSVQLASVVEREQGMPLIQLKAEPNDSVATYIEELTEEKIGAATAIITTSTERGDYDPQVTQAYAEEAARRLGFEQVWSTPLPDGREARLWVKR